MNVGLYIDARPDISEVARAAEEAGFSHLWVYDSPLVFSDTTVACVLALQATSTIAVGPGVANPGQRPAPHTAQLAATLNVLAPGRVVVGLGIGNSARRSLGMPPSTTRELEEHAEVVRAMLDGRTAHYREGERCQPVRFIHPQGRWIDIAPHVPIWVSAFGPRSRAVAGRTADGVLVRWEGADALAAARREVADAAVAAGRDPARIQVGVVSAVQPLFSDAELDTATMRAALGPLVVSRLRYLTANAASPDEVPSAFRDGFVAYKAYLDSLDPTDRHLENYRGYLVFTPADLERFVTPASMRAVAKVGPPEEIAEELEAMRAAGVDHVSLQMAGDSTLFCRRMAGSVLPLLGLAVPAARAAVPGVDVAPAPAPGEGGAPPSAPHASPAAPARLGEFDVLHGLKVCGLCELDALASVLAVDEQEVLGVLEALEGQGMVLYRKGRRVSGWTLTQDGREEHAELLDAHRPTDVINDLGIAYEDFLVANGPLKGLCAKWLDAEADPPRRRTLLDDLDRVHEVAVDSLGRAGDLVPRFACHLARLGRARELARGGDDRFVTSPAVPSYHTVWFQCHEDFLLTLGRSRAAEGSF